MADFVVYQNGQPVPVLPCLQRPDVMLRVREGTVLQVNVKERSSLHDVYRLPVGAVSFVVTLVEECKVSFGKEFLVTCEAGTRKQNSLCSFGKFSFLLSSLVVYKAVIDQPEMLLDCWEESPDVVVVGGRVVGQSEEGVKENWDWVECEKSDGTKAFCCPQTAKENGWKIVEGNKDREAVSVDGEVPEMEADTFDAELAAETENDRELLRTVQGLLHDAWDGWGGDVGLSDREIIALVGLRVVGTLLRKNADYGCSVWKAPVLAPDVDPLKAMLCRTSDKVERIATLSAGVQPQVVGEGLKDSILDNAGYSILMLGYILKQEMKAERADRVKAGDRRAN